MRQQNNKTTQQHWDLYEKTVWTEHARVAENGIYINNDLFRIVRNELAKHAGITDMDEVKIHACQIQYHILNRAINLNLGEFVHVDSQLVKAFFGNDYDKRWGVQENIGLVETNHSYEPGRYCKSMRLKPSIMQEILEGDRQVKRVMPPLKRFFKQHCDFLKRVLTEKKEKIFSSPGQELCFRSVMKMHELAGLKGVPMYKFDSDGGGRVYHDFIQAERSQRAKWYAKAGLGAAVDIDISSALPLFVVTTQKGQFSKTFKDIVGHGRLYDWIQKNHGEYTSAQKKELLDLKAERDLIKLDMNRTIQTTKPERLISRDDLAFVRALKNTGLINDLRELKEICCSETMHKWYRKTESQFMTKVMDKVAQKYPEEIIIREHDGIVCFSQQASEYVETIISKALENLTGYKNTYKIKTLQVEGLAYSKEHFIEINNNRESSSSCSSSKINNNNGNTTMPMYTSYTVEQQGSNLEPPDLISENLFGLSEKEKNEKLLKELAQRPRKSDYVRMLLDW